MYIYYFINIYYINTMNELNNKFKKLFNFIKNKGFYNYFI